MKILTWNDIKEDYMNPLAGRRALHAEKMTVARFRFQKGNEVAMHHHMNDQVTMVEKGKVKMTCGEETFELSAGQFVHVPPDVPHGNVALEDTIIIEIFAPRREDWISGDDSYLRQK